MVLVSSNFVLESSTNAIWELICLVGKRDGDSREYNDPSSNDIGGLVIEDIGDFHTDRDIYYCSEFFMQFTKSIKTASKVYVSSISISFSMRWRWVSHQHYICKPRITTACKVSKGYNESILWLSYSWKK